MAQLDSLEEQLGVSSRYDTAAERFGHLVRMSSARAGQRAVILVDEYDKPILDALDAPEVARANHDFLRGLYAVVKDCDHQQVVEPRGQHLLLLVEQLGPLAPAPVHGA